MEQSSGNLNTDMRPFWTSLHYVRAEINSHKNDKKSIAYHFTQLSVAMTQLQMFPTKCKPVQ